jgi:hypothetical protein
MDAQKQERRRFFRRAGLIGLIGAAATGIGWKAHAHGGWRRGEPLTEARLERLLQHFYIEIDATEEQKQRLGPIVREAVRELAPLRERVHAARAQAIRSMAPRSRSCARSRSGWRSRLRSASPRRSSRRRRC